MTKQQKDSDDSVIRDAALDAFRSLAGNLELKSQKVVSEKFLISLFSQLSTLPQENLAKSLETSSVENIMSFCLRFLHGESQTAFEAAKIVSLLMLKTNDTHVPVKDEWMNQLVLFLKQQFSNHFQKSQSLDSVSLAIVFCNLAGFIHGSKLDSQFVLPLLDVCYQVFGSCLPIGIQLACTSFLSTIFSECKEYRNLIMSEISSLMRKLLVPKEFKIKFSFSRGTVQLSSISFVYFSILQSLCSSTTSLCQNLPSEFSTSDKEAVADVRNRFIESIVDPITEATRLCRSSLIDFLQWSTSSSTSVSKAKVCPSVFLDDMLSVLFFPEWSVIENVLLVYLSALSELLLNAGSSLNTKTLALEQIGHIVVNLQRENVKPSDVSNLQNTSGQKTQCICGSIQNSWLLIECEICHSLFHGECIGVTQHDFPSLFRNGWACQMCSTTKQVVSKATSEGHVVSVQEQSNLCLEILMNYFDIFAHSNAVLLQSRQFFFAHQLIQLCNAKDRVISDGEQSVPLDSLRLFCRLWIPRIVHSGERLVIPRRCSDVAFRHLSKKCGILRRQDSIFKVILDSLQFPQSRVRSKALKIVSLMCNENGALLQSDTVCEAIRLGLLDPLSSVRETVMELLGQHLNVTSNVSDSFFKLLCTGMSDASIRVRQRVSKIIFSICASNPSQPKYTELCFILIRAAALDKAMSESIVKGFFGLWFSDRVNCQDLTSIDLIRQITSVIELSQEDHVIVSILNHTISDKKFHRLLQSIVDQLFDGLLESEGSELFLKPEVCFRSLNLVSRVYPHSILPHLTTLFPFVKRDASFSNGDKSLIDILAVLTNVLPSSSHIDRRAVEVLSNDLAGLLLSKPVSVMKATAQALAAVHSIVSAKQLIFRLHAGFSKAVDAFFEKGANTLLSSCCRGVYGLALLARYFDIESFEISYFGDSHVSFICTIISRAALSKEKKLQVFGIHSMFVILPCFPSCSTELERLSLRFLKPSTPDDVREVLLGCILDLLLTSSREVLQSENRTDPESVSGIIQHLTFPVFDLMKSPQPSSIRTCVLSICQQSIYQLRVIPGTCIPVLLNGFFDPSANVRQLAQTSLFSIMHQYPHLLSQVVSNIHLTLDLHISSLEYFDPFSSSSNVIVNSCQQLYIELCNVSKSFQLRIQFLKNVLGLCPRNIEGITGKEIMVFAGAATILANMHFSIDEPFQLLKELHKFASLLIALIDEEKVEACFDDPSVALWLSYCDILLQLRSFLESSYDLSSGMKEAKSVVCEKKSLLRFIPRDIRKCDTFSRDTSKLFKEVYERLSQSSLMEATEGIQKSSKGKKRIRQCNSSANLEDSQSELAHKVKQGKFSDTISESLEGVNETDDSGTCSSSRVKLKT